MLGGGAIQNQDDPNNVHRFYTTIRDVSNDVVLYSNLRSLSGASAGARFPVLLNEPGAQVELAASMVALGQARFGEELYYLALNGDLETVKSFLVSGRDVNIDRGTAEGWTPLMAAASRSTIDMASLLIAEGATVNVKAPESGASPLLTAVLARNVAMVDFLLENGAEVDVQDSDGVTALMTAVEDVELVNLLLDHGSDADLQDTSGQTALLRASLLGNAATVESLLQHGADVDLATEDNLTPLEAASAEGHTAIVEMLRAAR